MIATLIRYKSTPKLMLGKIHVKDQESFLTLEPPWNNNKKNLSCIPEGKYLCKRATHYNRNGTTYPAWEITNVPERTNVHIHRGNYPQDTTGCVLLGMEAAKNEESIKNSTEAFTRFMELTQSLDEFDLYIASIYQKEPIDTTSNLKPRYTSPELKPVELDKKETLYYKVREFTGNVFSAILAGIRDAQKKFEKSKWKKLWGILEKILTIAAGYFGLKK